MRRAWSVLMVAVAVTATGCSNVRGLFTARASSAAEAGASSLGAEQLGKILGSARGVQLNKESAELIANLWTNYALFAEAVADRKPVDDSATAAAALWPQLFELKAGRWHDTVAARLMPKNPGLADSIYNAGETRVLQHILIAVQKTAPDSVQKRAKAQAEAVLKQVKAGANFGELAAKVSADPGSARDNGYLNPSGKGAFVPEFEAAGWSLAPGAVSGLVQSSFGYHIIRRPPLEEVRERLTNFAQRDQLRVRDSAYLEDLAKAKKLEISKSAPGLMKAALTAPEQSKGSGSAIATYTGGKLSVADFLKWTSTVPPQFTQQLKAADDAQLTQFAKMLTQNVLFGAQADSAKVQVPAEDWAKLYGAYKAQVDSLKTDLGLNLSAVADSTLPAKERREAARKKVDDYFDKLVTGQVRLRPLPVALPTVLRERSTVRINETGITKALELARAAQAKADSAAGGASTGLQPAGPPPVPGGAAAPAAPPR